MTMADTVAVMNKGRIEQLGAPQDLYELPRTVFVADFLGQSNLFTGAVAETTSDAITVTVNGVPIVIPSARAHRISGSITIGVRPEKLAIFMKAQKQDASRNVLGPGRVIDVSFSGVSTQYTVAVPGLDTITVFAQNLEFGPVVHVGDEVWVGWDVQHGFGLEDNPAETGRFSDDTNTASIATQKQQALIAELEGT